MEPKTRKEHYLAKIAGEDVTIPEPKTRQEHYLKEIAENGSGYTVEETRTVIIPEQTVTTENDGDFIGALLTLADGISANFQVGDTLSITINGETKNVAAETTEGLPDNAVVFCFSGSIEEPQNPSISLYCQNGLMAIMTTGLPEATYTVKAESVTKSMTVSPEFQEAVAKSTEPLVVTLVPYDSDNPFHGTYVGATADEIRTAFLTGRTVFAKLGDRYLTPSILDVNTLNFYYTYNYGSIVLFIASRLSVGSGQNSYDSSSYTGLQEY